MNYQASAKQILQDVGGSGNVQSLSHCMTRLRFTLKDQGIVDDAKVKGIPGVMGVMKKAGQYQIVMGNDVADYYKELNKLGNFSADANAAPAEKKKPFDAIVDVISGCMSPLIPALIGGGMIKVLLILLPMLGLMSDTSNTYNVLTFFGDAPFYFMPIMLAFTASQKFGVNPMLAVTIAGIMLHPNFTAMVADGKAVDIFKLPITLATYSSSVIPILIMVWLMSYIEGFFDKVIPTVLKSFLKPLLIILVSGVLALVVVGPLGTYAGQGLSALILWLYSKAGFLAVGIMAALMPLIVMTGMHWAFAPIFLIASLQNPDVLILPAMLAANLAQGAAAMAVSLKAKDKNLKTTAFAAGLSALIAGVTEPALYGVTLRLKKPLYAAMIAGGLCGIYMGITGLEAYAFAVPSLVALPQFLGGAQSNFINALIVAAASIIITFVLTWVFGFEEETTEAVATATQAAAEQVEGGAHATKKIFPPVTGKVIPLEEVQDDAFSTKVMGEGIAIVPTDDMIVAPFNGTVTALFPTKHALGLTSDDGMEVLIHVGIDTVELNGKYFESFVETGDKIKQGQPLLKVDFAKVQEAGYDIVTPVVVTNTNHYIDVVAKETDTTIADDALIYVV